MPKKDLIFTLIEEQNWKKLRRHLNSARAARSCKARVDSNLTCLGMALGYQAPVDIIENIIKKDNTLLTERDVYGATALHVACLNGTRCDLIEVLLQYCPSLAQTLDYDMRAPLHHSIEFACQSEMAEEQYLKTVLLLCNNAPGMVHCNDHMGETPIDLVQYTKSKLSPLSPEHKRLDKLYNILKELSIKIYLELKRGWELEGHFKNSCNLKSQQDQSQSIPSRSSTIESGSLGASQVFNQTSENISFRLDSFSVIGNELSASEIPNEIPNKNSDANTNGPYNPTSTINNNCMNSHTSPVATTDGEGEKRPKRLKMLKKFSWK